MRIAVVSETAAGDKNADIMAALSGRGHEVLNVGMKKSGETPELQYFHTGLLAALLLNTNRADLVVGGCGTGQGFFNAAVQFPGVFCGYLNTPLDAWLWNQINGGNCISLCLNQGYGWAGGINLKLLFDALFSTTKASGYPEHRKEPQRKSRIALEEISKTTHLPLEKILEKLNPDIISTVFYYPGVKEVLDPDSISNLDLRITIQRIYQ
jgi:ribose 5-phosphate isomerase RpiB